MVVVEEAMGRERCRKGSGKFADRKHEAMSSMSILFFNLPGLTDVDTRNLAADTPSFRTIPSEAESEFGPSGCDSGTKSELLC